MSFAMSSGDGHRDLRVLVMVLTCLWGLRLAIYLGLRSRGQGEDPRYDDIFNRAEGSRATYALFAVFLVQAIVLWFISLPVQAAMYQHAVVWPLVIAGTALWVIGVVFESVGDRQLARFRASPDNKGRVMDRGLWRYTRHPNYFGDACVWWGLTLLALHHLPGLIALPSAAIMTFLLVKGTGAKLLESTIGDRRPGYADYIARTSGFVPLPPKRTGTTGH
jgi:steroid 5-alpha reductase family enzyme